MASTERWLKNIPPESCFRPESIFAQIPFSSESYSRPNPISSSTAPALPPSFARFLLSRGIDWAPFLVAQIDDILAKTMISSLYEGLLDKAAL